MGGVRGLSAQEVGVYIMLLCRMYEEDGPVEYHTLKLSTYCGMREKTFAAVAEKLMALGKIIMSDGMIFNARAAIEIADRADKLKNNSKAGKVSAEKRQGNQGVEATDVQQPFNHIDIDIDKNKEIGKPISRGSTENEILSELEKWVSRSAAESFIAYRKRMKGKALTVLAAKRIATTLGEIFNARGDPDDALGMAEEKGWMSVQADWYFRAKKRASQNGQQNAAFGSTINAVADGLSAGTIRLDNSRSDPFAPR